MKEEELIQASYILTFVSEIENFTNIASQFIVYKFNLKNILKNEGRNELTQQEKIALMNFLDNLRILATKIKLKYETVKEAYKLDIDLENYYKKLFEHEDIEEKDLFEFTQNLNKISMKLSERYLKIVEKYQKI